MKRRRGGRGGAARALAPLAAAAMLAAAPAASQTAFEPLEFETAAMEARYRNLIAELRCLVCQNQNLADSDAELARDLRAHVYEMLANGETDDAIYAFMTERYGDFVLYRPPLRPATLLLWAAPALLGAGGLSVLWLSLRRRSTGSDTTDALDEGERAEVAELLGPRDG